MFCKYCGKEIADDAKFCSKCGKQLNSENQNTVSQVISQPVPTQNKKLVLKNKKILAFIAVVCFIGIVIPVGIHIKHKNKELAVQAYIDKNMPLLEEKNERFKIVANKLAENFMNRANYEEACSLSLDYIEAYLDFYEGLVKIEGKGNYKNINESIDFLIEKNEKFIDSAIGICSYDAMENFSKRQTAIHCKWLLIRQI